MSNALQNKFQTLGKLHDKLEWLLSHSKDETYEKSKRAAFRLANKMGYSMRDFQGEDRVKDLITEVEYDILAMVEAKIAEEEERKEKMSEDNAGDDNVDDNVDDDKVGDKNTK